MKIKEWWHKPRNGIPFFIVLLLILLGLLVLPARAGAPSLLDSGYDWNDSDPAYCNTEPVIGATYHREAMTENWLTGRKDSDGNALEIGRRWCMNETGAFLFSNICTLNKNPGADQPFMSGELCMIDLTSEGCLTGLPNGYVQIDLEKCEIYEKWETM